jgi:hypothetical protein
VKAAANDYFNAFPKADRPDKRKALLKCKRSNTGRASKVGSADLSAGDMDQILALARIYSHAADDAVSVSECRNEVVNAELRGFALPSGRPEASASGEAGRQTK